MIASILCSLTHSLRENPIQWRCTFFTTHFIFILLFFVSEDEQFGIVSAPLAAIDKINVLVDGLFSFHYVDLIWFNMKKKERNSHENLLKIIDILIADQIYLSNEFSVALTSKYFHKYQMKINSFNIIDFVLNIGSHFVPMIFCPHNLNTSLKSRGYN